MTDVNMNAAHRTDFKDARRGEEAMQGIGWMLEHHPIVAGGERITLGNHLLEIGAAFGSTTVRLRHEVERLTAVEVDSEMAAEATRLVAGTNAEVVNVDASDLPFANETFSAAVCTYVMHHVPTPQLQNRVLAETVRVLRPGGAFFGWDSLDGPEIREYHAGDVFVPLDLATFPERLRAAGFTQMNVESGDEGRTIYFAARA